MNFIHQHLPKDSCPARLPHLPWTRHRRGCWQWATTGMHPASHGVHPHPYLSRVFVKGPTSISDRLLIRSVRRNLCRQRLKNAKFAICHVLAVPVVICLSFQLCLSFCVSFIFVTSVLSVFFCRVNFVCHFDRHFFGSFFGNMSFGLSFRLYFFLHIAKMFFSKHYHFLSLFE